MSAPTSTHERPPLSERQTDGFFRANVGILLVNAQGLVFVGERKKEPGAWQLPQGGIDPGEEPEQAARREICEEIGLRPEELDAKITKITAHPSWLAYELPRENWRPKQGRGQVQKFFICRLEASVEDAFISERVKQRSQEFGDWKWTTLKDVADGVWAPRRPVYDALLAAYPSLVAG